MSGDPENLITPCSLAMSLAPPRAPPYDSAHRNLMCGNDPSKGALTYHHHHRGIKSALNNNHNDESIRYFVHDGIKDRISQLLNTSYLSNKGRRHSLIHPHLPKSIEVGDQLTRFISTKMNLSTQNRLRDDGTFRSIVDRLVYTTVPLMSISNPKLTQKFIHLSRIKIGIQYGEHKMQKIDLYLPSSSTNQSIRGFLFFVHGGAWGSGMPWMYRLVALPFLEKLNMAVAIVGYRTFPDADVSGQVNDLELAALHIAHNYSHLLTKPTSVINDDWLGVSIMGHSSGAHIALLLLIEHIARKHQFAKRQQRKNNDDRPKNDTSDNNPNDPVRKTIMNNIDDDVHYNSDRLRLFKGIQKTEKSIEFDSFIGLSGPYNISNHFDYEGGRGVEEISPMKPACGYTRESFLQHSPEIRLQRMLPMFDKEERMISKYLPPILLVHGIEDDVVPFPATSDAARMIRACGVTHCTEYYVPGTKHQEVIMHFMLGGKSKDFVFKWLLNLSNNTSKDKDRRHVVEHNRSKL